MRLYYTKRQCIRLCKPIELIRELTKIEERIRKKEERIESLEGTLRDIKYAEYEWRRMVPEPYNPSPPFSSCYPQYADIDENELARMAVQLYGERLDLFYNQAEVVKQLGWDRITFGIGEHAIALPMLFRTFEFDPISGRVDVDGTSFYSDWFDTKPTFYSTMPAYCSPKYYKYNYLPSRDERAILLERNRIPVTSSPS